MPLWLPTAVGRSLLAFDLFGHLAEDDPAAFDHSMPRSAYREGTDSHSNRLANETVGPLFSDFVMEAASQYRAIHAGTIVNALRGLLRHSES